MYQGGTVKQFKDVLEEMKTIYPYDDEKTRLCTSDVRTFAPTQASIVTTDEATGIIIQMTKGVQTEHEF